MSSYVFSSPLWHVEEVTLNNWFESYFDLKEEDRTEPGFPNLTSLDSYLRFFFLRLLPFHGENLISNCSGRVSFTYRLWVTSYSGHFCPNTVCPPWTGLYPTLLVRDESMDEQKIKQNRWAWKDDGSFQIQSSGFLFYKARLAETLVALVERNCNFGGSRLMPWIGSLKRNLVTDLQLNHFNRIV